MTTYHDRPNLKSSNERLRISLELHQQIEQENALGHSMTSRDDAIFAASQVVQTTSDETSIHSDEAVEAPNDTYARDPEEPNLKTVNLQQTLIRNDRVSSDSDTHEAQSAEPAIIHFSLPQVPEFRIASEETQVSRRARDDKQRFHSDCVRIRTSNDIDDASGTRGELQRNRGGVYVESEREKEARFAYLVEESVLPRKVGVEIINNIGGNIVGDDDKYLSVNNTDTDIKSQESRRPYLVLGLLSTSTSIPKEEMIRIKSSTRVFKELHKAASKLRPWPIRILSLKSESGFAIYECTKQGIHSRIRVDQSTQNILIDMFRAYNSDRRDFDSRWLSFVHKELNNMESNPRLGKHSLQLVLSWSALKLVIWGSTPIILSLVIGFWYMFKSHPGEDPVAIVQTAWGISSYIVTAGARKYYPQSSHASFRSNSKIVAIAILAAVTQIG